MSVCESNLQRLQSNTAIQSLNVNLWIWQLVQLLVSWVVNTSWRGRHAFYAVSMNDSKTGWVNQMAQEKVETCTMTMLSRNPSQELLMRSSISVESATIATGEPARQNNSHRLSSATEGVKPLLLAREHRETAWNRCKVDQRMYSRSRIGFLMMWSRWKLEFYESRLWQVSTTPLNLSGVLVADPWQI